MATPAPVVVKPSGQFDGNDGNWSTFGVRAGTPPIDLRVLVSTLIPETWVIAVGGCTSEDPKNCSDTRGQLFDTGRSSSWLDQKTWTLSEETNLNISPNDTGNYGYESLGITQVETSQTSNLTLGHQVIAAIETKDFYLGSLGLTPRVPNFYQNTQGNFLQSLKDKQNIPSLSYGYTAGAYYRDQALGSLTLGGYDASRFSPSNIHFTFGPSQDRDLLVGLQGILYSTSGSTGPPTSLLKDGIFTFIDSTLPNMWLPVDACNQIASAFGLTFSQLQLNYLVNDTAHETNLKNNASVTFILGNNSQGGATVNITLPYASFDLQIGYPIKKTPTRYFPLRQATKSSQYTLGRAFLQEAYLIVDYERGNFSVSQCDFSTTASPHIIAIPSINSTSTAPTNSQSGSATSASPSAASAGAQDSGAHTLSAATTAGIAVAVVAIAVLGIGTAIFLFCRRNRRRKRESQVALPPELEAESTSKRKETSESPIGRDYYAPDHEHQKHLPITDVPEANVHQIEGRAINPTHPSDTALTQEQQAAAELSAGHDERAEMQSPEPVLRSDVPSPEPTAWGDHYLADPGSAGSDTLNSPTLDRQGSQSGQHPFPSPGSEQTSPFFGHGIPPGSAFHSPAVGYREYGGIDSTRPSSPQSEFSRLDIPSPATERIANSSLHDDRRR